MTLTLQIDDTVTRRFPGYIQAGEELVSLVRDVWPCGTTDMQMLEPGTR